MPDHIATLLAAASAASSAATDMIEAARDGKISAFGNIGSGETCIALADALRMLLDATSGESEDETQLHGAVIRYLESQSS